MAGLPGRLISGSNIVGLVCPGGWQRALSVGPNPGIEPRSPTMQADSLPLEPQGKPENAGVDSLSLIQQIFLTQESNRDLLHWRWILNQLSYQGSPIALYIFSL